MLVHEIPGVLVVEWNEEAKAMIDTWSNYAIKVSEFRDAILTKGVAYARANKARAWIVDSTNAESVFTQDIQKLIETEVFKAFAAIGIKYFITIKSATSAITNMSISHYATQAVLFGVQLVEVSSLNEAIAWLKAHQ